MKRARSLRLSATTIAAGVSRTGIRTFRRNSLPKSASVGSKLEAELTQQLEFAGIASEREYRFAPPRRWRFDFAWPEHKTACEVEGGMWVNGRHNRPAGFAADLEKYNTATILGWRVLRVCADDIKSGMALEWINQLHGMATGQPSPTCSAR